MTPAVSVVTIFLDAEDFLPEAIESVYSQTVTDWELILVDDGSSDGSTAIALELARRDPDRVRYLDHPGHANRGMSASRNLGIAAARSAVLALLDADDVYLPEKLEHQLAVLDAHPEVSMVYGPATLWYGWTGLAPDIARDRVYPTKLDSGRVIEPPDLFVSYVRRLAPTPATCSVLFRRDLIDRVGGFEETFTGMYEDQVFFHKVALSERVTVIDRPLDRYRQHPGSASAQALATGEWHRRVPNQAHARFMEWLTEYSRQAPPYAHVVRREVRRERRRAAGARLIAWLRPATHAARRARARVRAR